MPVRVTLLFNRADEAGWSESYYSNASGISGTIPLMQGWISSRQLLLAQNCNLYAVRYTDLAAVRTSQLVIVQNVPVSLPGLAPSQTPDVGPDGVLVSLVASNSRKEQRILRGLPDSYIQWSNALQRMTYTNNAKASLDGFLGNLTAPTAQMGWFSRLPWNAGGTATIKITAVTPTAAGSLQVTLNGPNMPYDPQNTAGIVINGFTGPATPFNGFYGPKAYSLTTTNQLTMPKRSCSDLQVNNYQGTAYVRLANQPFTNYVSGGFSYALIRTRRIGRPFGGTRGRRSARR